MINDIKNHCHDDFSDIESVQSLEEEESESSNTSMTSECQSGSSAESQGSIKLEGENISEKYPMRGVPLAVSNYTNLQVSDEGVKWKINNLPLSQCGKQNFKSSPGLLEHQHHGTFMNRHSNPQGSISRKSKHERMVNMKEEAIPFRVPKLVTRRKKKVEDEMFDHYNSIMNDLEQKLKKPQISPQKHPSTKNSDVESRQGVYVSNFKRMTKMGQTQLKSYEKMRGYQTSSSKKLSRSSYESSYNKYQRVKRLNLY